ncbi:MAG TPA: hypothetical protein VKF84_01325 [Candidatus Sulfotelmatobacter sp.]|nr:hypothetical protein [Candidatus Sulfotelmatobacter sp.]
MKKIPWALLLILTSALCHGRSSEPSGKADLSQLSSDQLKTCVLDPGHCTIEGHPDEVGYRRDLGDELVRRLPTLTSEQLVACFDKWEICGAEEDRPSGWPISDEIARRGDPHELLVRYWKEHNWIIRNGIEHVAYHFDTPEVTAFMQRILAERVNDGEDRYWPVNYLAKKCDNAALKEVRSGRYRGQGSLQYQTSVELFGKCKYRPAIPYLVDVAVYDFSFNISAAADHSLHALYPDSPDFDMLEDMQRYFCGRAKQEGFRVHCNSKMRPQESAKQTIPTREPHD